MKRYMCKTCGTQYPASEAPPEECTICQEERQYVHPNGQEWTTVDDMIENGHYENDWVFEEEGIHGITTKPSFAIGQTAYFVQTENFNILWDCLSYLDKEMIDRIHKLGGLDAIALSHPHYYSAQVEWAETFNVPIYIHNEDRQWVMRPSEHIQFWTGEQLELSNGLSLHCLGGHYKGGTVLHWEDGNEGKGALFSGDVIQVVADRNWVSFMYSYPNLIPLPPGKVAEMAGKVKDLKFNRIYNAFHRIVRENGNEAVQRSADRYIKAIEGKWFTT